MILCVSIAAFFHHIGHRAIEGIGILHLQLFLNGKVINYVNLWSYDAMCLIAGKEHSSLNTQY
jgi:hypothetical protein